MVERDQLPLDIEELSMSPEDELTLFFFMGDESRQSMEKFALGTFKDMKAAAEDGLDVDGKKINIKWIMACDWKAAAILKGVNMARCDYFCLWCYCRKQQICDFSIPSWPVQRSADDQVNEFPNRDRGYILSDLCDFIPYSSLVPDDLHCRIRISLKLFNQQLQLHNFLEGKEDRHLVTPVALTVDQLKDELTQRGLPVRGKKAVLVTRLTEAIGNGNKVVKKSNRSRLQVSYAYDDEDDEDDSSLDIDSLQQLWDDFDRLMDSLRCLPSSETYIRPDQFQELAREWARDFRKYTFDEDVTPYIHAFVYHVPSFLEEYRYLHDIGVSQVERKNYDHRQAYFGSTNRNGGKHSRKISIQILERENRLLYYKLEGKERKKRKYTKNIP